MDMATILGGWCKGTCAVVRRYLRIVLFPIMVWFCGLLVYWIWGDTSPVVVYGEDSYAFVEPTRITFFLDATRVRDCPGIVRRKVSGCGQVDLPLSFTVTPVGEKVAPITYPLNMLTGTLIRERLEHNICTFTSQVEAYCNPVQQLLGLPIITQSRPILFVIPTQVLED